MAVVGAPLGPTSAGAGPGHRSSMAGTRAVYEHQWLLYVRTWRGSIFGSFAQPVLFLVAMGIGLGAYVDAGSGGRRWAACRTSNGWRRPCSCPR